MSYAALLLIFTIGIVAGFLNTVGGGGSLLTLPIMIFLGMPSAMANGTNRVSLIPQNISAVVNFRRKGYFDLKFGLLLALPAIIGSFAGAILAVNVPDSLFNKILAFVMLIVLFLTIKKPAASVDKPETPQTKLQTAILMLSFFAVGFYGGFVQAGVGFIIIAVLYRLTGMNLVKINSLKVFVVLLYIMASLFIFVKEGQIDWVVGITLAAGNAIGAWFGSSFAVSKGDKWIRIFIIGAVSIMSLKLLGVFSLIQQLFLR